MLYAEEKKFFVGGGGDGEPPPRAGANLQRGGSLDMGITGPACMMTKSRHGEQAA